jgi:acyl-CoA synthetase (AMP-forming)/AMP-acid ligase II
MTRLVERSWLRAPNFGDVIAEAAALYPNRTAVIADDFELDYGELDRRAGCVASFVRELGVAPREVVALAMGNDARFVECLLGVLRSGSVGLLVNTKLGADMLAYIAGHSSVRLVLGHEQLQRVERALLDGAPRGCRSLTMGAASDAYEDALAGHAPAPVAEVDPDELALLMYTSGSTGLPKGVMLSHSNTWWQARSDARTMMMDWADRGLVMGPLYHANALWAILLPMLYVGGSLVLLPDFDPPRALEAIDRHGITFMSGTPSMYSLLLAEAERGYDLSSIELLQCGSAPVPEELLARIQARFTRSELVETYGLTEGGANVLTPRWGIKKLGSTGLPVPDVEIRVVDPTDPARDCGPGEIGEMWTRSPANALGYLNDPDRTAEKFVGDGWLRTGDLFRRDEQGYCYFCGRTDDMISVGGENVYPKEVETIILLHPAVADVGVVPAPHPVKGEAPVAWVVLKTQAEVTEDEIKQHFLANGPAYAHPRRVFFVDTLPVSGTNKLDRAALQQMTSVELPEGLAGRTAGAP